jgi:hypothetical protein
LFVPSKSTTAWFGAESCRLPGNREVKAAPGNREVKAGNREVKAGNREVKAGNREVKAALDMK